MEYPTRLVRPCLDGRSLAEIRKLSGAAFEPSEILVVEDAPSGLKSGLAAGCKTLGVATGQPLERFRTFEATVKTMDLTRCESAKRFCSSRADLLTVPLPQGASRERQSRRRHA